MEFPSPGFLELCADVENLIYVIRLDGSMFVAPHYYGGTPIRHSVPAGGKAVLAAGELEAALDGSERWILNLNRESGHYRPGSEMLDEIAERLQGGGFVVPSTVIDRGEDHRGI